MSYNAYMSAVWKHEESLDSVLKKAKYAFYNKKENKVFIVFKELAGRVSGITVEYQTDGLQFSGEFDIDKSILRAQFQNAAVEDITKNEFPRIFDSLIPDNNIDQTSVALIPA